MLQWFSRGHVTNDIPTSHVISVNAEADVRIHLSSIQTDIY